MGKSRRIRKEEGCALVSAISSGFHSPVYYWCQIHIIKLIMKEIIKNEKKCLLPISVYSFKTRSTGRNGKKMQ